MTEEEKEEFELSDKLEAHTVYEWVKDFHTANPPPPPQQGDVQHAKLKPTLRSYQERAVRWMLSVEQAQHRTVSVVNDQNRLVRLEKGGILADEMGLGKTVEVLACLLANPNTEYEQQLQEYIDKMKEDLEKYKADAIKKRDENSELNAETEEEICRPNRRKRKGNDNVVAQNITLDSHSKTKPKRFKSVYSEVLDDTLFVKDSESVCEGENISLEADEMREKRGEGDDNSVPVSGEDGEELAKGVGKLGEKRMEEDGANEVLVDRNSRSNSRDLCDKRAGEEGRIGEKSCGKEGDKERSTVGDEQGDEEENYYKRGDEGKTVGEKCDEQEGEEGSSEKEMSDKRADEEGKTCGRRRPRKIAKPKRMTKQQQKKISDSEVEEGKEDADSARSSKPPGRSTARRKTCARKNQSIDDSDDDADFVCKTRGKRKASTKRNNQSTNDSGDSDFVCKTRGNDLTSSSRRSTRQKRSTVLDESCFDEDEDDPSINVSSEPRRARPKADDPDFMPAPKKRAKSAKTSLLREQLQKMYETMLSETSPAMKRAKIQALKAESDYRCCCLDPSTMADACTVQCEACGKLQHQCCVSYEPSLPYVCFRCWPQRAPVPSNATLIISPSSISEQWSDEIKKHVAEGHVSVMVYNGVRGSEGYTQPLRLAQYDIVITSYQVLMKEIDFANINEDRPRTMRYARKFFPPSSPLTCVGWWRICLDEAQMVECVSSKPYSMVSSLHTVHRWAVCGTPIQRHVSDLYGLFSFLQVEPYGSSRKCWQQLENNWPALAEVLPHVMWRTGKCHVLHELNVPPQRTRTHWLTFTPTEFFFYRKQHDLCSAQFRHKADQVLGDQPRSTRLCQVTGKQLTALMTPLLRLRQACVHPQLVRGQFVAVRHTLTMPQLLEQMVASATTDAEETLRQVVCSLNGVAGASVLVDRPAEAVDLYRRVLHLAQDYEGRLKMDTLQKVHTMYNLAKVLPALHGSGVAPTLRDGTLPEDIAKLERNYLNNRLGDVAGNRRKLAELADKLSDQMQQATRGRNMLRDCDWWSDMLQSVDTEQLLHKIQIEFEHAKGPLKTMLKKMSAMLALTEELYQWQRKIDEARQSVIEEIKQLEETPTTVMAGHALYCHLRNKKPPRVEQRCLICRIEEQLKQYESLLFWIMNKNDSNSKNESPKARGKRDIVEADTTQSGAVANLENNTIFQVYNTGTWKPSQHEQIIKLIYNSCSKRLMKAEWANESQAQFAALVILRKEFRRLRLLWSQLADQVAASDELSMAKCSLRLANAADEVDDAVANRRRRRRPAPKTDSDWQNANVLHPDEVDWVISEWKTDLAVNESALRKAAGTLQYLLNLQENGDKQTEPCPVCKGQLTHSWSVLKCGHCYCYDCIHMLTRNGGGGQQLEALACPVCREVTFTADVSHIEARPEVTDHPTAEVKGSYTTKIAAMVSELIVLRSKEPQVKVLIFSKWDGVLDVLAEALTQNEISHSRLPSAVSSKQRLQVLAEFKQADGGVCALLLPLRAGAKGLNLVEATHVFLAEPILNPADQLQAIGRVHRIGQTRETFVHKFAIKGTIEERMTTAMEGSDTNWSSQKVTVQQLIDLFNPVEPKHD
ncbi:E3 ubiquitin-protein ligase SHPRH [Nilaparvata lugens]|uniref:E3 ubiquitin-protein ligase SHPRH n=1 Tax=Nilaparvata lugens TaxID=108931 RepID=UPI00193CAB6F|nr:E3 ubiquitin-protein ligase SHPRH [Nilaparvata lugens]